ncbi:NrpR regulatory domain-containing protein [Archaeoglobus neptunius]|uniref:NrpR regulatory domain-containing protein n=1 Tax=Archaeoglobus neptunius TaxID=2798580 RepID=UPI001925CCDB|nr:NrpR regulatory domain-containing protein [Archaeoglobus neptunius]
MVEEEILSILEESGALSSIEIEKELELRGVSIRARTVRYHLKKLEEKGLVRRNSGGKAELTEKGLKELKRKSAFERLGEFSERIEFNVYFCDFDVYSLSGLVPTNVAFIDKNDFDMVLSTIREICDGFPFLIAKKVVITDEMEEIGGIRVPKGKFALGAISNTLLDVILRGAGISTYPEYAALLSVEDMNPRGITELISYVGTTLSPGQLLLKAGLTSVHSVIEKGRGEIIVAIRSFSRYAIDIARRELELAESKGIGGVIKLLHPADRRFGLPAGRRARMIVSAGLNFLAPIHEKGVSMDIKVNELFVDFKEFRDL